MLVVARACQGAFGALLAPAALSLLTVTFRDSKDRGKAFGVFGAIAAGGGAVGLLLGGLLTQYLDWRWCLFVNLVFAALACAGAVLLLRRQPAGPRPRLDLPGLATEVAGMFCVVYGFSNAASDGWHATVTWGFLLAGAALLAAFGYIETRASQPLLPLRIVADRNRAASYLSILITGAGMFGIFLFLTYYLQETLGFSPVTAGLAFLPMVAGITVCSNLANIVLLPRSAPGSSSHRACSHPGRPGLADPDRRALQLRGGCPAGTAAHLRRARLRDVAVDEHRDRRRGAVRRRHGLRRGQHRPAGRRLDRHVPAQHRGGQRGRQLPGRSPQPPDGGRRQADLDADPARPGAQLHHRILVGRRDIRRRVGPRCPAVPPGRARRGYGPAATGAQPEDGALS